MCERRPNYCQYPGQLMAQYAYLQIDEDGEVTTGYIGGIGREIPMNVWNGRVLRFDIQAQLTVSELEELVDNVKENYLPRLLEVSEISWNGSNYKRTHREGFDAYDYADVSEDIKALCERTYSDDFECCDDKFCDYCYGECPYYRDEQEFIEKMGADKKATVELVRESKNYEDFIKELPYNVNKDDGVIEKFYNDNKGIGNDKNN